MSISATARQLVRNRASFACEYCGVSEADCGGELCIDHHRPRIQGGDDDPANLIYCCFRCNLYKADYWPLGEAQAALWNPRQDSHTAHFLYLSDGQAVPLSATARFTIARLRLNRSALIAHRLARIRNGEMQRAVDRIHDLTMLVSQLDEQLIALLEEHRQLLEQQRELLKLLVGHKL
jgi:hypothetical protein